MIYLRIFNTDAHVLAFGILNNNNTHNPGCGGVMSWCSQIIRVINEISSHFLYGLVGLLFLRVI